MPENASPPTPDEQPTAPFEAVAAAAADPAPGHGAPATPADPAGPVTTAYPAGMQAAPRRRMPGWAVAVSVVGGFVLLGIGFAGGLGTGLLISHHSSSVAERADLRGSMMDRLGQGGSGQSDQGGQGRFQGGRSGDGPSRLGGAGADQGDNGVLPSPSDGSTTSP